MALPYDVQTISATIAAGVSLSGPVSLGAKDVVGFVLPATWTAAPLTFLASADGVTFFPVWTIAGAQLQIAAATTAAGGVYVAVDPTIWRGINMLQLQSGVTGSLVNQVAQAVIGIVVRSEV